MSTFPNQKLRNLATKIKLKAHTHAETQTTPGANQKLRNLATEIKNPHATHAVMQNTPGARAGGEIGYGGKEMERPKHIL